MVTFTVTKFLPGLVTLTSMRSMAMAGSSGVMDGADRRGLKKRLWLRHLTAFHISECLFRIVQEV
ncbi:hypothetical protein GCM10009590_23980 [Brachybacterium alimentarium]